MRKRDKRHEDQFDAIQKLDTSELTRRLGISNHNDPDYVPSEVITRLVRSRASFDKGVVGAAVAQLNVRILQIAGKRILGMKGLPEVERRGDQALPDTVDYIWDHILDDNEVVSNAEVRFAVFVRDRFDDFMRHLRAEKNSMDSVDAMQVNDDEGHASSIVDTVEDINAEDPLEALITKRRTAKVMTTLMALPKLQRNAFYFRVECEYDWGKVAELLACSIPTAKKHYNLALEQLKGALE